MKNLFVLLILVGFSVASVSCDGRKSSSESLKSSIAEFNEEQSDVVIVSYYPKDYTEVVTDTLISNHVNVHIKNYSLSNESLFMSVDDDAIFKKNIQHRIFESDIVVSTPSKEILNAHISAGQFKSMYSDEFWNHATLEHVWVNQELSKSNDIKLEMSFINPSNSTYKVYRMSISENGHQTIELLEERT
jgi:hypothetical protein